jgi:hypothetical protein
MRLSRRTWLAAVMGGGLFGRQADAQDRGVDLSSGVDVASYINPEDSVAFGVDSKFYYFIGLNSETAKLERRLLAMLLHTSAKNGTRVTSENSKAIIQVAREFPAISKRNKS